MLQSKLTPLSAKKRADWKSHKPACQRTKRAEDLFEIRALSQPASAALVADINLFCVEIDGEYVTAARIALRFGRPDAIHTTHLLELYFEYHPDGVTLRERFEIVHGEVISMKAAVVKYSHTASWDMTREEMDRNIHSDGRGFRGEYQDWYLTGNYHDDPPS